MVSIRPCQLRGAIESRFGIIEGSKLGARDTEQIETATELRAVAASLQSLERLDEPRLRLTRVARSQRCLRPRRDQLRMQARLLLVRCQQGTHVRPLASSRARADRGDQVVRRGRGDHYRRPVRYARA